MLHREPPYNSTMNNAAPASFGTRCWSEQLQYPYSNSYQNNQSGSIPFGSGRCLQLGQCSYSSQQSLAAYRLQRPYTSQPTQPSHPTSNPYSYPSGTSNFPQSGYSTVQTPYPTENSYQPLPSSSTYPGNQYQPPQQQSPYPTSSSTSSNSSQNDDPYTGNPYNTETYSVAQTSSYPQVLSTSGQRKGLGILLREPPYNSTMNNNSPASLGTERWAEQSQYPCSNSYQSNQSGSVPLRSGCWLQPGQCSYSSQQSLAASRLQSPYNSQCTQPRYPPQVPYPPSNPYSSSSPYPPSTAYPSSSYPSTYPYPSQTSNFHQSYYSAGQIPYPTGYCYQPQSSNCPYPGSQYQPTQYQCYYPASYPYPCGNRYNTGSNSGPQGSSTIVRRKGTPTVVPARNFDPVTDASALRKAMKGLGTDEYGLINVICQRSNPQRQEIQRQYKTQFERDLIEDITSETSGNFRKVLVGLLLPIVDFYVKELNDEMTGKGTEGDVLIEVLCTLSNAEIHNIKKAYTKTYGHDLESTLKSETSGNFKKLLVPLCAGDRDESYKVDLDSAKNDARNLFNAGELRFGTDKSIFNMVLCQRNFQQLKLVFQEYQKLTGHSLEEAIKREFSGDIEDGLMAIFRCIMDTDEFFATRLHKSMVGIGTRNNQLIRIIITRCEIDLKDIKQTFERLYGKSLKSWIKGDTSGDYKHALYSLIGEAERSS